MKQGWGRTVLLYCLVICGIIGSAHWGSRTVTAVAETAPVNRQCRIILDAGHGGVDGGATSCAGKLESAFNLEIALRLRDLIHLLGYETVMIRTSDVSVYTSGSTIAQKKISDLKERVRICNETEGGILLSIHQNYFSDPQYAGPQVFYSGSEESETLAKQLQQQLNLTLAPKTHRQAKKASGIYLMANVQCPAVLVECGFLSNPQEEARLRSPAYQKKLCCILAAAAVSFANT